jgi:hypothetical protein
MMQETILSINETYHNFITPDIGCKKECGHTAHSYNNVSSAILLFPSGSQFLKYLFLLFYFRSLQFPFF